MKRVFVLLLTFVMVIGLSACVGGESGENSTIPEAVQEGNGTENGIEADKNQTIAPTDVAKETEGTEMFIRNDDLRIVAAFKYNGYLYVVAENAGEQPIINFDIAYINFDRNGFTTTTNGNGYEGGSVNAANLMPGEKSIFRWYSSDGEYTTATVIHVDYADGAQWNATNINYWVEETKSNFTVDQYNADVEALADEGQLAESNEYVSLDNYYLQHGNQFSTQHDLWFTITNKSEQAISIANVYVLEFDDNGFPVNVSPYDTYCMNGHSTGGTVNLAPGQTNSYSDDLFTSASTAQIKVIVTYLEFQDGTEWHNPYMYEWILTNHDEY